MTNQSQTHTNQRDSKNQDSTRLKTRVKSQEAAREESRLESRLIIEINQSGRNFLAQRFSHFASLTLPQAAGSVSAPHRTTTNADISLRQHETFSPCLSADWYARSHRFTARRILACHLGIRRLRHLCTLAPSFSSSALLFILSLYPRFAVSVHTCGARLTHIPPFIPPSFPSLLYLSPFLFSPPLPPYSPSSPSSLLPPLFFHSLCSLALLFLHFPPRAT